MSSLNLEKYSQNRVIAPSKSSICCLTVLQMEEVYPDHRMPLTR
jgi:hypothetical protein